MKMQKMALAAVALVLALGVSVCSAHCPGRGGYGCGDFERHEYAGYCRDGYNVDNCGRSYAYAAECKDGVCEFVPSAEGNGTALAVLNPYNNAVPDIEGQWERDVKQLGSHDVFVAGQGESNAGVVFSVNHPIKNFKVLSLHFKEYTKDVFRPDRKLLVKFTFFGSIPNNGISYTDSTGKTRYYTVDSSGKDGSLYFTEF